MSLPPAVTIHGREHAHSVLSHRRPVLLLSAPGAALFAGPLWWRAVVDGLGTTEPDALDCADAPGRALEALAADCRLLVLAPGPAWASVAARARHYGATLLAERPPSLDLARRGAERHVAAWLASR